MGKKHRSKSVFNGFRQASNTPVPDDLFDELLEILTGSELKVLLYIIRRTKGFNKDADAISLSQFQHGIKTKDGKQLDKGCGISDRQTIVNALESLETKKCIGSEKSKTASGDNAISVYRVLRNTGVVGNSSHPGQGKSKEIPTRVDGNSNQGGWENPSEVVGNSNPQETVIQQTELQETVIQQSITSNDSINHTIVPNGTDVLQLLLAEVKNLKEEIANLKRGQIYVPNLTPSPTGTGPDNTHSPSQNNHRPDGNNYPTPVAPSNNTGQKQIEQKSIHNNPSNLIANGTIDDLATGKASANQNMQQETLFDGVAKEPKPSSKKIAAPMPPMDAIWNEETAVQIIEAKKGRRYSETTRAKEKSDAKKILSMWYDDHKITRDEFEKAVDNMFGWSCWQTSTVKPMIKYLLRDDKIIGVLDNLKAKPTNPSSTSTQKVISLSSRHTPNVARSSYDDPNYVDDTFYGQGLTLARGAN